VKLNAIVAVAQNRAIGKDNDLIWRLSNDLKHFKNVTQGHCIISGRKNYESIGRPLPGRTNIILTRDTSYQAEGCEVVHTLKDALKIAEKIGDLSPFIIGGGEIYRMTLPYVDTLYYTEVHQEFDADVFFPELTNQWQEISREKHLKDEKNQCDYSFVVYKNTLLKQL